MLSVLRGVQKAGYGDMLENKEDKKAVAWLEGLKAIYGDSLFVELVCHGHLEEKVILKRLVSIAEQCSVKTVATNSSRYATKNDFKRFDLQTCIRLGISINKFHPDRVQIGRLI